MRTLIAAFFALVLAAGTAVAGTATPLVSVDWVRAHLGKPDIVFLDVRGRLAGASKQDYLNAHIPGAIWTDYLKDGWRIKNAEGTIGQLPSVPQLEALIGGLGISNDDHVVIIPAGGRALDVGTATRIYWTFKVLGHDAVSILDGGFNAYVSVRDEGTKAPLNPLESGEVTPEPEIFSASLRTEMLVSKADVAKASTEGGVLVDNRPNNQYLGINKHGRAARPGTIPGARNLPENWLTENGGGTFRDKAAIAKLYEVAGVPTDGEQIAFCNNGHWASLGWFASSEILGNKETKLYDGSMVEWAADKSLPVQSALQR
jgi:thiosulfate/3-mercaptopyruvate sulfurtransferase